MAAVNPQNLVGFLKQTDHFKNKLTCQYLQQDLDKFLNQNKACQCVMVALNIDNKGRKTVFQVRGKLSIKLPESGNMKMLGFKFLLPFNYPQSPPHVYLDEPENPEVIEMVDYLDGGNRIMFEYLMNWAKQGDFK